ncbi:MerR family transcriptional regulator [Amycolatopsis acidiphila]|uniref:MerR family transcriptional regulator n=1 Tax=Amycolatopsis acidiphila TaxID=715473 RepID=A0A557ZRX9_9PSEU|nr:MerR family transcriptional regulator [Amycolatopsis acidiphila]TVT14773.1 MerR family transcriptional regulator [Amycolatopsis acidiphila]UIJ59445.1 MerR family transcriptional regulator [Amycolatopsis acidiphila]GHG94519.1 MerR family transcriptional regulator [Amycolatopsis acidiphila]
MDSVSKTFTIGELARRTALPVKTIRFYSDEGLLPPTDRTHAGYRLYDTRSLARLELIRTLRELGLGLEDVAEVLASRVGVPQLAARHLEALDEQIRRLRLRRAVLRAVVKRESELEEVKLMNKLASMSDEERVRLLDEFWAEMMSGLTLDPEFAAMMRSAKPTLPDDPTPEQVEAWVEFAELIQDPSFRASIRAMSERQSAAIEAGEQMLPAQTLRENWSAWSERAQEHLAAGVDPASAEGRALAEEIVRASNDVPAGDLADQIDAGNDPRAERYWQLLAIMNGWPPVPDRARAVAWIAAALRAIRS